jgi:hypothetical protein
MEDVEKGRKWKEKQHKQRERKSESEEQQSTAVIVSYLPFHKRIKDSSLLNTLLLKQ